MQTNKSKL